MPFGFLVANLTFVENCESFLGLGLASERSNSLLMRHADDIGRRRVSFTFLKYLYILLLLE